MEVDASNYLYYGGAVLFVGLVGGGVLGDNDRDMGHIFSFTQLNYAHSTHLSAQFFLFKFFFSLFYFWSHISRFLSSLQK